MDTRSRAPVAVIPAAEADGRALAEGRRPGAPSRAASPRPAAAPQRPAASEGLVRDPAPVSIALDAVSQSFAELRVIERVDLDAAPGEVVGIVGPSGCGKTTLLEVIAGLRKPSAGSVEVGGEAESAERLARCAYMPQRDLLLPWLRAIDNAALALRNRGASRSRARLAAEPLFERFGLAGFESARPSELSGGMRQRVAFLRTLLAGKPVLLLDEPFAALDAITRGEMQEWLAAALAAEPRTVLLVTHDVEEALYLCDRVVVLGPRPARTMATLACDLARATPRIASVTDPRFTALRERALEALAGGSG